MLDPFYCGDIEYPDPAWQVKRIEGKHEGIISKPTFERLQDILKRENVKRIRLDVSSDFPLRGLILCDHCGNRLTAAYSKKIFPYYVCHTKSKEKTCECYGKSIRRSDIEGQFTELLQKNTLKPEISSLVNVVFKRVWGQEINLVEMQEADNIRQVRELENKAQQLTDAIFNPKLLPQVKNVYEKQLEDVALKIEEKSAQSTMQADLSIPYRTALEKAIGLLKNPYIIWQTLDVVEKHRLFNFIFEEKLSYNQKNRLSNRPNPACHKAF